MNFDVFTTAAVVDELTAALTNGRVQDTLEVGGDAIGLEIYAGGARHYVLLSADSQTARVHLASDRLRRGVETPSPIGLMLRRYVEGAYVAAVRQPAWERVVEIEFDGVEGVFTLIAETMERRSNILLVREGRIMDCIRRVGARDNRVRVSLPGYEYVPPPPQKLKRAPNDLTLTLLENALDADPGKVAWRSLTDTLLGFSPMLAKEAVYRAMDSAAVKAGDTSARSLFGSIQELLPPLLEHQWQPGITTKDDGVTGFAAYPVTFLPGWQAVPSISEALAEYYGAPVGVEAYTAAKEPVKAMIAEGVDRVQRRLDALHRSQRDDSERERLRYSGELLMAYQHSITPKQTTFSAQYDFDLPALDIKLDTTISVKENAKRYFEEYEKAKRAAEEVPALLASAENEMAFLNQIQTDLELASNAPEISEVQDALQVNGYWKGPKIAGSKGGKSAPLKVTTPEGIVIWVGRNSRQNEEVTFSKGKPEDLWLHAHEIPGAHVIIKTGGRTVAASVLQRAAGLAAYYSAGRGEGHVLIDVTERRHVRKIKGGRPGMVTYRNESPIEAVPTAESAAP